MCRYQEGGKRGLPVAYMTSLETRLVDTEAALYATLCALHDQRGITSESIDIETAVLPNRKYTRSKADKQHEWKQRPLRTSENIATWFVDEQRHTSSNNNTCIPVPPTFKSADALSIAETLTLPAEAGPRAEEPSVPSRPISSPPNNVIKRLRSCKSPNVPNTWRQESGNMAWTNNYF
jgi:hypothetical protein